MDVRRAITGYQLSQALHVAATLNVAELLDDGPRPVAALAESAGADPEALYRLLRALARVGVFEERPDRVFALNEAGEELRRLRSHAAFIGRPMHWDTWSHLIDSVRTGEAAFPKLYGETVWEYRASRPEESEAFDAYMTMLTQTIDAAIVSGYDFGRYGHVLDVGGGRGAFLSAILARNPRTRGTLFDQPHVVDGVTIERAEVVGGSFFDAVPRGGDAYVLKSVIHDWGDQEAVAILRTCAAALEGDAQVLVVELDLDDPAAPWVDLQMLVSLGGRERTAAEYAALFRDAGLDPLPPVPTGAGFAVYGAATSPKR